MEIFTKLNSEIINYKISSDKVLEIIKVSRCYIQYYLKHCYALEDFSIINKNERFAVDEISFANISKA
jgi:hypothetical protein